MHAPHTAQSHSYYDPAVLTRKLRLGAVVEGVAWWGSLTAMLVVAALLG